MPNNEKPLKGALFSLDENGERQDANLHAELLNTGDHTAAQAVSMAVMRRAGLSPKTIARLMPWVIDKAKLDGIRSKKIKPNIKALEDQAKMLSSPNLIRTTLAYRAFLKAGERALPLLRRALESKSPSFAVVMLLDEITGEQPYATEDMGNLEKMREAWLRWFSARSSKRQ